MDKKRPLGKMVEGDIAPADRARSSFVFGRRNWRSALLADGLQAVRKMNREVTRNAKNAHDHKIESASRRARWAPERRRKETAKAPRIQSHVHNTESIFEKANSHIIFIAQYI